MGMQQLSPQFGAGSPYAAMGGYNLQMQQQMVGQKHDPFNTSPAGPYSHGQFGIFNMPGSLPTMYSAMVQPASGLANDLPVLDGRLPSYMDGFNVDNLAFTLFTGVTAGNLDDVDNQPTSKCAEPPTPGYKKLCTIANPVGRYWGATASVSIVDLGRIKHIHEPVGFNLANFPTQSSVLVPSNPAPNNLELELANRIFEMQISWQRMIGRRTYISDPTNSAASNNWRDFVGLDIWINQNNKRDMYTSNVCTAANSVIFDAVYTSIVDDPEAVFGWLEEMYLHVMHNADTSGLNPVFWKFAMRRRTFLDICRYWPVAQTLHSAVAMSRMSAGNIVSMANDTQELGQRMYQQAFIPIMGDIVPVVIDDYIPEDNVTNNGNLQPGEFSSDIYLVPYTVMGGVPVTGWTFNQMFHADAQLAAQLGWSNYTVRDGGRSLWMNLTQIDCMQLAAVIEPRLCMFTPHVAGRLQNVKTVPQQHLRDWDPNSQYHYDGGRTNTPAESYYTPWGTTPSIIGNR